MAAAAGRLIEREFSEQRFAQRLAGALAGHGYLGTPAEHGYLGTPSRERC
jgi:hypothetical protein